jgi:hypothetical protein
MYTYYIYSYRDPNKPLPFYIGKGSGNRKLRHLKETKETTENYLKWCKIQSILNRGEQPIIEILFETNSEEEAYDKESELIKQYGRIEFEEGGCLTNRCIDARPPTYAGKLPRDKEYRKNISIAKLGIKNPMFGKDPWNKGKPGYSTSKKGQKRKWITDGIFSKQILQTEEIPSGWRIGRTGGAKGSRRTGSNN